MLCMRIKLHQYTHNLRPHKHTQHHKHTTATALTTSSTTTTTATRRKEEETAAAGGGGGVPPHQHANITLRETMRTALSRISVAAARRRSRTPPPLACPPAPSFPPPPLPSTPSFACVSTMGISSGPSSSTTPTTMTTPSRGMAAAAAAAAAAPVASAASGEVLLKDEYGVMDASGQTYIAKQFVTEHGATMENVEVRYNTFGRLNEAKDNVLVVCHALTGNARLDTWWSSILGPGKPFDTNKYLVVCANILGSCYGTTGPMSTNPATGKPYGIHFPQVTIRDSVNLHIRMCKEALGANQIACVVGGSLGGMQALEWAFLGGASFVRSAVVIACGARHTAWQIGISETQRQAIYADPNWQGGAFDPASPPVQGLAVARQIAMFSYRTPQGFDNKFGRSQADDGRFEVRRYLEYQGQKFLSRFDALTYVRLTEKMDTHDVGRGRGGVEAALKSLKQPVLVLGIDSDVLYPLHEQEEMAALIPQGELKVVRSREGHDGFLLEQEEVGGAIAKFMEGSGGKKGGE